MRPSPGVSTSVPEVKQLPAYGVDGQVVKFEADYYVYDGPFHCWRPLIMTDFEPVSNYRFH